MVTFQKPFYWCSPEDFLTKVCEDGRRCNIPKKIPAEISDLIQQCWSHSPSARPEFSQIMRVLEEAHAAAVAPQGKSSVSIPIAAEGKSVRMASDASTPIVSICSTSSCPGSPDTTVKKEEPSRGEHADTTPPATQRPPARRKASGIKRPGLLSRIIF
jgi:hypothetical protein